MITDFFMVSFNYMLLKLKHDKLLVAAFGFGCSYLYFSMCFLYGFSEFLGIYLPKFWATKNYRKSLNIILKVFFLQSLSSIISTLLIVFSPYLMKYFDIN